MSLTMKPSVPTGGVLGQAVLGGAWDSMTVLPSASALLCPGTPLTVAFRGP